MKIKILDLEIFVEVIYKPFNKGLYIKYLGDNRFRLTTPLNLSDGDIEDLFFKNYNKIKKTINGYKNPSNTIHYLGRCLNIIEYKGISNKLFITEDSMHIEYTDESLKQKIIKKFYNEMIKEYVLQVFDELFLRFEKYNLKKPRLEFKYTTSFYGKCYPKLNLIEISGMCMKMPKEYIDVVICHELCHLKILGHQKDFYKMLEGVLPNAKKLQHELRMLKYKDVI